MSVESPATVLIRPVGAPVAAAASRYVTMGVLAVAIMMLAYLAAFSLTTWSQQKAVTFEYLQTTAEVESRALDAYFRHSEQSLRDLRNTIFDADGRLIDKTQAYAALQRALQSEPDWQLASISDLDGKTEMATTVPLSTYVPAVSAWTRPGWASALNELRLGVAMSIGRGLESTTTHKWVMPLRFGVRDRNGNLTYILSAAMPLARPLGFWSGLRLPPDGAVAILRVDEAVYLIARNPLPPSITAAEAYGEPRTADFAQRLLAGKLPSSGTYDGPAGLTGTSVLWGYARLYNYPLVFLMQSPRALLWQRWWASVWLTYLIFGVLLIGGYTVYRWIVARQLAFYRGMAAAEARLRASQSELQRIEKNLVLAQKIARVGSFEHDIATDKIEWSDEMYEILGLDKTAAAPGAETFLRIVHPEDRARLVAYRASEMENKRDPDAASSIEYRIIRPDGAERILHRERYVIYDETGQPVRRYGTLQDITEQKRAEMALQRHSEALARAQRLAMVGSIEYDIVTGTYECSDETYCIFGIPKTDVAPDFEMFLRYIHPDDRDFVRNNRLREIAGDPIRTQEFRIIRGDGAERIIRRETDIYRDAAGKPIRRCGTLQDVTELRLAERRKIELERQLLHSQKLEALGTLAGGIAHDLNNALVPILALSKITLRQLQPGSTARDNLETIFVASEHARDLVKRVLAFSRKETSAMSETRLDEVVSEALKLLRSTIPSSIQIEERIAEIAPIRADASGIQQIVTNLVTNAVGAIGDRPGKITITVATATGDGCSTQRELCLSVADTGKGMDEATRARIFEPFFTTKQVGEGTGLGLSIVHGIVGAHGGRIEVDSAPEKGTCFHIYLPAGRAEADAAA